MESLKELQTKEFLTNKLNSKIAATQNCLVSNTDVRLSK